MGIYNAGTNGGGWTAAAEKTPCKGCGSQEKAHHLYDGLCDSCDYNRKNPDGYKNDDPSQFEGRVINLTPHPINLIDGDGRCLCYQASGEVARVESTRVETHPVAGFPCFKQSFGAVDGLPDPEDGVVYIVSGIVLAALAGTRPDVVAPDTGAGAVRNDAGQIVGVRGFVR